MDSFVKEGVSQYGELPVSRIQEQEEEEEPADVHGVVKRAWSKRKFSISKKLVQIKNSFKKGSNSTKQSESSGGSRESSSHDMDRMEDNATAEVLTMRAWSGRSAGGGEDPGKIRVVLSNGHAVEGKKHGSGEDLHPYDVMTMGDKQLSDSTGEDANHRFPAIVHAGSIGRVLSPTAPSNGHVAHTVVDGREDAWEKHPYIGIQRGPLTAVGHNGVTLSIPELEPDVKGVSDNCSLGIRLPPATAKQASGDMNAEMVDRMDQDGSLLVGYGLTREDIIDIRERISDALREQGISLEDMFDRDLDDYDDPIEYFLAMEVAFSADDSAPGILESLSLDLGSDHQLVAELQRRSNLRDIEDIDAYLKESIDGQGGNLSRNIFVKNPEEFTTCANYYKSLESSANFLGCTLIPALAEKLGSEHPLIIALSEGAGDVQNAQGLFHEVFVNGASGEISKSISVELPVSQGGLLSGNVVEVDHSSHRGFSYVHDSHVRDETNNSPRGSCMGCFCLRPQ